MEKSSVSHENRSDLGAAAARRQASVPSLSPAFSKCVQLVGALNTSRDFTPQVATGRPMDGGRSAQVHQSGTRSSLFVDPRTKAPQLAWFSKSTLPKYRDLWVAHGGKATTSTSVTGIQYFFATSKQGVKTKRLLGRKNTLVYHPSWIDDSVAEASRRPLGQYILADYEFAGSHETLPFAEPTPVAPSPEDFNGRTVRTGTASSGSATPPPEAAEVDPEAEPEKIDCIDVEEDYRVATGAAHGVDLLVRAVDFDASSGNPYRFRVVRANPPAHGVAG